MPQAVPGQRTREGFANGELQVLDPHVSARLNRRSRTNRSTRTGRKTWGSDFSRSPTDWERNRFEN